jgi:hypothetical protein
MNTTPDNGDTIQPSWRWATPEGNRELDRLLDRRLTFREKLEWLEEAERLTLQLRASRETRTGDQSGRR